MKTKYGEVSEASIHEAMTIIIKQFAECFSFPGWEPEDIAQECWVIALEKVLPNYNPKHSLQKYLFHCIKQKLLNLKRNNFADVVPPCKRSHENYLRGIDDYSPEYRKWVESNREKRKVRSPSSLRDVNPECDNNVEDIIFSREIIELAYKKLDRRLSDILRMWLADIIVLDDNHELFIEIRKIINAETQA